MSGGLSASSPALAVSAAGFRFSSAGFAAWVLAGGYTEDTRKVVQVHLNTFDAALEVYDA